VPDPSDGRAKLIVPTDRGHEALMAAGVRVSEIEQHWGRLVGDQQFNDACYLLNELLSELAAERDGGVD
jgi:hypothetical protein